MEGALSLGAFIDAWELFRDPVLAGTIAGALLGFLGVYIVLRRMVFLSAALSQAAGLGVAAEFYAQIHWGVTGLLGSPLVGATGLTLLTAWLLSGGKSAAGQVRRDSLLGLAYLVGSAGAVAIGTRIVQEVQDIHSVLFGSAVVVLHEDLLLLAGVAGALGLLHLWWMRGFLQASFDREGAAVRGLPVRLLDLALLGTLAVAISVSTRVLGALPVFAFSVLPAMAAVRLVVNVPRALLLGTLLGALSGFAGYVVAFRFQLPVGAAQALVAAALVPLLELGRLVARRATRPRHREATPPPAARRPLPGAPSRLGGDR